MSVYRVIDVIGTSSSSWEEAAAEAITTARGSVRDIRVAEVTKHDILVGDGGTSLPDQAPVVVQVRTRVSATGCSTRSHGGPGEDERCP